MARSKSGKGLVGIAMKFLKKADHNGRRGRNSKLEPHALRHMMQGNANSTKHRSLRTGNTVKNGTRTGYHYRPGGQDFPGRMTGLPPSKTHPSGAYEAPVWFEVDKSKGLDGSKMEWEPKKGPTNNSTFFPDHWGPEKIDNAVSNAFTQGTKNADGTWTGVGPDGLTISGRYDPANGGILTAFPVI
jgi:hypothetical protein